MDLRVVPDSDTEPPQIIRMDRVPIHKGLKPRKTISKIRIVPETPVPDVDTEIITPIEDSPPKTLLIERTLGHFNNSIDEEALRTPLNVSIFRGPPYTCLLCNAWFCMGSKLKIHYIMNHDKEFCKLCGCIFDKTDEKSKHFVRTHRPFVCEICKTEFDATEALSSHYISGHDACECMFCGVLLQPTSLYESHVLRRHSVLKNKVALDDSFRLVGSENNTDFFCGLCDKMREKCLFYGHMHSYHKISISSLIKLIDKEAIRIPIDGAGSLPRITETAKSQAPPVKDHCPVCQLKYTIKMPAGFHHVYCLSKFQCKFCDAIFDSFELRDRHSEMYHNTFACLLGCDDTKDSVFSTEKQLHMHYATDHAYLSCPYCDLMLTEKTDNIENHLTSIHKYKLDFGFNFRDTLFDVTSVDNNKSITCVLCGENITSLSTKTRDIFLHFSSIHSISVKKVLRLITPKPLLMDDETYSPDISPAPSYQPKFTPPADVHSDLESDFDPSEVEGILDSDPEDDDELNEELSENICELCGIETVGLIDLITHLKTKHRLQAQYTEYICEHCKDVFINEGMYERHLVMKHGMEEAERYECGCDDRALLHFAREHLLTEHSGELAGHDVSKLGVKCRFCEERFWERTQANEHEIGAHFEEKAADFRKCYVCFEVFSSQKCLRHHVQTSHPTSDNYARITYKCLQCTIAFPNTELVREHFKSYHPGSKVYWCQITNCGKVFKTQQQVLSHMKKPHRNKRTRVRKLEPCNLCGIVSRSVRAAVIHKLMKHQRKRQGVQCRICKERFATDEERKLHYTTIHPGELAYICLDCGKGFQSKSGLYGHRRMHNKKTIDICPYCSKEFSRRDSYNEHLLIHVGPRHQCPHCPKSFTQRTNLTRHVRIHTGSKPYMCMYCDRKFSDRGACRSHERVHTKEEHCSCMYCGKTFSKWQKLKYHMKFHTGEGLLQCDVCDKKFSNTYSLTEHRRIHNNETVVMCECGKGFAKQKYLNRHKANKHGPMNRKKYTCPLCFRILSHHTGLIDHLMTHSKTKHIRCTLCDSAYNTRKSMRRHLQEKHQIAENMMAYMRVLTLEELGIELPPGAEAALNVSNLLDDKDMLKVDISVFGSLSGAQEALGDNGNVDSVVIKSEPVSDEEAQEAVVVKEVKTKSRKKQNPTKYKPQKRKSVDENGEI